MYSDCHLSLALMEVEICEYKARVFLYTNEAVNR